MIGYYSANVKDIKLPPTPTLDTKYTVEIAKEHMVSISQKNDWEKLMNRSWDVDKGSLIYFIKLKDKLVGSGYFAIRNRVGTAHSFKTLDEYRKQGFYKYIIICGIKYMMNTDKIDSIAIHTSANMLWNFWKRMGFKEVDDISYHAKAPRDKIRVNKEYNSETELL